MLGKDISFILVILPILYIIQLKQKKQLFAFNWCDNTVKGRSVFDKCIARTLQESDFELGDKSRKGSIRKKIQVLKTAVNLFDGTYILEAEERFIKNKVGFYFS